MNLTKADIADFQSLYLKHTGKKLDYQSAYAELSKLVRHVEIVYQPAREIKK